MTTPFLRGVFKQAFTRGGVAAVLRRPLGTTPSAFAEDACLIKALPVGSPEALAAGIQQGETAYKMLAQGLDNLGAPRAGDRIKIGAQEVRVEYVDRAAIALDSEVLAYTVRVKG